MTPIVNRIYGYGGADAGRTQARSIGPRQARRMYSRSTVLTLCHSYSRAARPRPRVPRATGTGTGYRSHGAGSGGSGSAR